MLSLLELIDKDDIIILVGRHVDARFLPPGLVSIFEDHRIIPQDIGFSQNLIVLIQKGTFGTFLKIPNDTSSVFMTQGEKIGEIPSPTSFEAFIDTRGHTKTINIRLDGQTVLKTDDFGVVIVDTETGKVIESGPINREMLLVNDTPLYKITKR